jgi:hypothetical protein
MKYFIQPYLKLVNIFRANYHFIFWAIYHFTHSKKKPTELAAAPYRCGGHRRPRPRPLVVEPPPFPREERLARQASTHRRDLPRLPSAALAEGSPWSAASAPGCSFSRSSPSLPLRTTLVGRPALEKGTPQPAGDKVWVESNVLGPPVCYCYLWFSGSHVSTGRKRTSGWTQIQHCGAGIPSLGAMLHHLSCFWNVPCNYCNVYKVHCIGETETNWWKRNLNTASFSLLPLFDHFLRLWLIWERPSCTMVVLPPVW